MINIPRKKYINIDIKKYKTAYWRRIARGVVTGHTFRESRKNYKNHIRAVREFKKNFLKAKTEAEKQYWASAFNDEIERRRLYEGYEPQPLTNYIIGES